MTTFNATEFFGGAITAEIPDGFIDARYGSLLVFMMGFPREDGYGS
jgi:hypothetical protein